jgi:hypothetical protein
VPFDPTSNVSLSPDGTRLLADTSYDEHQVLDLRGKVLTRDVHAEDAVWADDSRHLCAVQTQILKPSLGPQPARFRFMVIDPGHGTRIVPRSFTGTVAGRGMTEGGGPPGILHCSVSEDTAFVGGLPYQPLVPGAMDLKTGNVTTPRWVRVAHAEKAETAAVSGNGRYTAEAVSADRRSATQILDTTTGTAVAQIRGEPQALSWNGHVVLLYLPGFGGQLRLVNWQTGATLWRGPMPKPHKPYALRVLEDWRTAQIRNSDDIALFVSKFPLDSVHQVMRLSLMAGSKATPLDNQARWIGTDRFGASW